MKSKASIKGHPLHPILIPFPIAFFIGAFIFDLLALLNHHHPFWKTGYYLSIGGIVSAIVAAIPGAIDYIFTVPPKSSAKKRATKHALSNSSALFCFVIALLLKQEEVTKEGMVSLVVEGIGVGFLFIGGWLGGTLVYRNQIGVDSRYAHSGKWKEQKMTHQAGKPVEVAEIGELQINQMKLLHINGKRIVLGRIETGYVAFEDRCTHKGGALAAGTMICGTVACPWHGSQFNVETGMVAAGPATNGIKTYKATQRDDKVYLSL